MQKIKRKILTGTLALALVLCMMPSAAFAAEAPQGDMPAVQNADGEDAAEPLSMENEYPAYTTRTKPLDLTNLTFDDQEKSSEEGWDWQYGTGGYDGYVLTLNGVNFNCSEEQTESPAQSEDVSSDSDVFAAIKLPAESRILIVVNGNNTITMADSSKHNLVAGIYKSALDPSIDFAGSGTLTIQAGNNSCEGGFSYGIYAKMSIPNTEGSDMDIEGATGYPTICAYGGKADVSYGAHTLLGMSGGNVYLQGYLKSSSEPVRTSYGAKDVWFFFFKAGSTFTAKGDTLAIEDVSSASDLDEHLQIEGSMTLDESDLMDIGGATQGGFGSMKIIKVSEKKETPRFEEGQEPYENSLIYNGEQQELVYAGRVTGGTLQYAIGDSAGNPPDDGWSTEVPTAAEPGTYYVWYRVIGDPGYRDIRAQMLEVEIRGQNPAFTKTPELNAELNYNGSPQALIKAGEVTGGTLQYAIGTSDENTPAEGWSTAVPTATEPGTYYVWYRVIGDKGYNNITRYMGEAVIQRSTPTFTAVPKANTGLSYSGSPQELIAAGNVTGGTLQYAIGTSDKQAPAGGWNAAAPKAADAGRYYVWYKVTGNAGYNDKAPVCITVDIAQAEPAFAEPQANANLSFSDKTKNLVTAGNVTKPEESEIKYAVTKEGGTQPSDPAAWKTTVPTVADVTAIDKDETGKYTVWYQVDDKSGSSKDNYKKVAGKISVTVSKLLPTINAEPVIMPNLTAYNGNAQTLLTAGEVEHGMIKYAVQKTNSDKQPAAPTEDSAWTESVLPVTDAGYYHIWYKVDGAEGYGSIEPVYLGCAVIEKANPVTKAPAAKSGLIISDAPQDLIIAGTTAQNSGLTMQYTVTETKAAPAEDAVWEETVPARKDIGNYYVWYKVDGNANYNSTSATLVSEDAITITDPDQASVNTFLNAVDAIGQAPYTDAWSKAIDEARKAYDVLSDKAKDRDAVKDALSTLTNAESGYKDFEDEKATEGKTALNLDEKADPRTTAAELAGYGITWNKEADGSYSLTLNNTTINAAGGDFALKLPQSGDITITLKGKNVITSAGSGSSVGIDAGSAKLTFRGDGELAVSAGSAIRAGKVNTVQPLIVKGGDDEQNAVRFDLSKDEDQSRLTACKYAKISKAPQSSGRTSENYQIPVKGDDTVQVSAQITDGTAAVSDITSETISKITNHDGNGSSNITIDLSGAKQEVKSVILSKKTIETLAQAEADKNSKIETVTIKMSNITAVLDSTTLQTLNKGSKNSSIQLVAETANAVKNLNAAQQDAIRKLQVVSGFEVYFINDGQRIHDFQGGKVTVSVPFKPQTGKKAEHYHIYYVADNGQITRYQTKYENGRLVFTTTHFSDYVITYDESVKNDTSSVGTADEARIAALKNIKLTARSKMSTLGGKRSIRLNWYDKAGTDLKKLGLDGYEVMRSAKRYSGYGTTPYFTTSKAYYHNTKIQSGSTYYYKVRGYINVGGKKYYTSWSDKAWRTVGNMKNM